MKRLRGSLVLLFALFLTSSLGCKSRQAGTSLASNDESFGAGKIRLVENRDFPGSFLYLPNDGRTMHPGVVVLHGSDGGQGGGFDEDGIPKMGTVNDAYRLAKEGFAAFAFCYFNCGDEKAAPHDLVNVDMARTARAMQWFKENYVGPDYSLALYGGSRGAEQALLLSSYLMAHPDQGPVPDSLEVHAPTSVVNRGITAADAEKFLKELATAKQSGEKLEPRHFGPQGPKDNDLSAPSPWTWGGKVPPEFQMNADIPIELYARSHPVLISFGTADCTWPSEDSANYLIARLHKAGIKVTDTSIALKTIANPKARALPNPQVARSGVQVFRWIGEDHFPDYGSDEERLLKKELDIFLKETINPAASVQFFPTSPQRGDDSEKLDNGSQGN